MTLSLTIYREAQTLRPYARRLWKTHADADDGLQDTIVRAIANQHLFKGGNIAAWLTTIMKNIRSDQASRGFRKGTKGDRPHPIIYTDHYDYAYHIPSLDTPEAILSIKQEYAQ